LAFHSISCYLEGCTLIGFSSYFGLPFSFAPKVKEIQYQ
jgi:hypothetical protein